MVRDIIEIDEELCNGCGNCVPGCHEGALQIIDGKARLISDLMCDGLGACVGHCPTGAMKVIKREAEEYDEKRVMTENIIPAGAATIRAHLDHLMDHGEDGYHAQALEALAEAGVPEPPKAPAVPESPVAAAPVAAAPVAGHGHAGHGGGCPGSAMREFLAQADTAEAPPSASAAPASSAAPAAAPQQSELRQWPVQLHLLNPAAPYFRSADVLLAADCTAYALGDFHSNHLKGKSLAIACPKLDHGQESYVEKITAMIDQAQINTLTVMMMEVPCCSGLLMMAQAAAERASRKVPIKKMIVGIEGGVLREEWA